VKGKYLFDVTVAGVSLVLLTPLFFGIGLLVLLVHGRPVLFRQRRPGLHGIPFTMYKFRTMNTRTDSHGQLLPDEQRLTSLGRFLRATSLDELPELLNVVQGKMSIVGPRPLLMEYLDLYTSEQARRHETKPGITGWAQVNGRNAISWEEKFSLDVWYVDNQSFLLDLKIIGMTLVKVLRREGISEAGQATARKFTGTEHGQRG
jgi:lipopolysaccharide/colanic/teichoic acid biosynthesis glycosyltransferase